MANDKQMTKLRTQRDRLQRRLEKYEDEANTLLSENLPNSADVSDLIFRLTGKASEIKDLIDRWDKIADEMTTISNNRNCPDLNDIIGDMTDVSLDMMQYVSGLNARVSFVKTQSEQSNRAAETPIMMTPVGPQADTRLLVIGYRLLNKLVKQLVQLPKLELKKFDGNLKNFREFWDSFEIAVHCNDQLQPVEKMNYLLTYLEGEARSSVFGLSVRNENYPVAVALILELYGNPQTQLSSLYARLMNLPPAPNSTVKLRKLYDEMEAIIRSLISLDQTVDSQQFVSIIKSKLPREILLSLERSKGLGVNWTADLIRQRLHTEICAREAVDLTVGEANSSSSSKNIHNPVRTGQALINADTKAATAPNPGSYHKSFGRNMAKTCIFCEGNHYADECRKYGTVSSRRNQLKGRYFNYLSNQHIQNSCKVSRLCVHCSATGKHHRSLCIKKFGPKEMEGVSDEKDHGTQNKASTETESKPSSESNHAEGAVLASGEKTAVVADLTYDVLRRSYIDLTTSFTKRLSLKSRKGDLVTLNSFGTGKTMKIDIVETQIDLRLKNSKSMRITVSVVPQITGTMHRTVVDLSTCKNMVFDLPLADKLAEKDEECTIDLLIGSDYYLDIVTGEKLFLQNGLCLLGSHLGWILSGRMTSKSKGQASEFSFLAVLSSELHDIPSFNCPSKDTHLRGPPNLEQFWAIESIGIMDSPYEADDDIVMKHFNDTVKFENQRYQNSDLHQKYSDIIKDQELKGVIEKVGPETDQAPIKHYIPHQAVIIPLKTTTKVQIVYDVSAKANKTNPSLNDCLYRGQVFIPDLTGLLMRFRVPSIAIISDIEKAFLQVGLQVPDRDVTRFLWLKDPTRPFVVNNLQIYRFQRVPFGMVSSPFLLGATIDHLLLSKHTLLAEKIRKNVYMDNIIIGAETSDEATAIYKKSKEYFRSASMNLREWVSNDTTFNTTLPEPNKTKPGNIEVLGLGWNTYADTISIQAINSEQASAVSTKREVLKLIAQTFDPLGLATPITITGKLFLRQLWEEKMNWDDPLTEDQKQTWLGFYPELLKVAEINLPRKIGIKPNATYSLLCFCDASSCSYATVLYRRSKSSHGCQTDLIFAKTRLKPQKKITIPRMELLAATIGANALKFVETHLHIPISEKYLFSDSQCVLGWVKSEKKLPTFVENRVTKILSQKNIHFRYVKTEDNPADLATRGKTVQDLTAFWWKGPQWAVWSPIQWPTWDVSEINETTLQKRDEEPKTNVMHEAGLVTIETESPFGIKLSNFSSIQKVFRITALCLRFVSKIRKETVADSRAITAEEIEKAKCIWETCVQKESFLNVITDLKQSKPSQLVRQLGLYLDTEGLIRCRGRIGKADLELNTLFPKLLPTKHRFTELSIVQCHQRAFHAGVSQTLATIRREYWIPHGRATVKRTIGSCLICRRHEGGAYTLLEIPNLSKGRVVRSIPFSHIGIDYFGPLYINDREIRKAWVCLFTCMATRAVHLELMKDMTTEQFLLGFQRFTARRGKPQEIVSDNAPQFRQAKGILQDIWGKVMHSMDVQKVMGNKGIKWKYIVEFAPWMGGFYERLVGVVKKSLRKVLGNLYLTYDQLSTILSEIEAMVYCRPLAYVSGDLHGSQVLTPADFLQMQPQLPIPTVDAEDEDNDPTYNPVQNSKYMLVTVWKKG